MRAASILDDYSLLNSCLVPCGAIDAKSTARRRWCHIFLALILLHYTSREICGKPLTFLLAIEPLLGVELRVIETCVPLNKPHESVGCRP